MEKNKSNCFGSWRDGRVGDMRESFLDPTQATGSERRVTSASALLGMEGLKEKQREAVDDTLREAGRRKGIKEEERTGERGSGCSSTRPPTYIWV